MKNLVQTLENEVVATTNLEVSTTLLGGLKTNDIYGIDIPKSWSKEIEIFGNVFDKYRAKRVTYSLLLTEAISLRDDYGLKPYASLSAGSSKNFENRLARFIGGTYESATKSSKQSKFFNCEVRTGQRVTGFTYPIVSDQFLSPQVKAFDQSFVLPRKLVKKAEGNIKLEDIVQE